MRCCPQTRMSETKKSLPACRTSRPGFKRLPSPLYSVSCGKFMGKQLERKISQLKAKPGGEVTGVARADPPQEQGPPAAWVMQDNLQKPNFSLSKKTASDSCSAPWKPLGPHGRHLGRSPPTVICRFPVPRL